MKELDNSEFKLLMHYLQENNDELLNERIQQSPQLLKKYTQLQQEMSFIEKQLHNYQPDIDYGERVWEKIADKLPDNKRENIFLNGFRYLIQGLNRPRFSLTGLTAIMAVFFISLLIIRPDVNTENISEQRLLAQNIHRHLTQTEIFLTQVSNTGTYQANYQRPAQQLLATNRLFKVALGDENPHLSALLSDLERVFLEMANQPTDNTRFLKPNQQRLNEQNLLFKVKTMAHQLDYEPITL